MTSTRPGAGTDSADADARRMCFDQGKPFVFMPRDDDSRIVAEYASGVVEEYATASKSVTRTWPDGRVERFRAGDPRDLHHPDVPPATS